MLFMALVKFIYAASATAAQKAAFDADTLYFIGNENAIYKGTTKYDAGAGDISCSMKEQITQNMVSALFLW